MKLKGLKIYFGKPVKTGRIVDQPIWLPVVRDDNGTICFVEADDLHQKAREK